MCVYFSRSIFFKGTLPCGEHLFQYSRSVGKSKAKIKIFFLVLLNVGMIVCFILYYQPWLLTCFKAINFLCTVVYKALIHTVTIFHANIDLKKLILLLCFLVSFLFLPGHFIFSFPLPFLESQHFVLSLLFH